MLININDGFPAQLKQELAYLKQAEKLIDEVVPEVADQLGMHTLLNGSIISLQEIINAAEQASKKG